MGKLSCLTMRTDTFFNGRMYHHCTLYSSGIIRDNTTKANEFFMYKKICGASYIIKPDWKYVCACHRSQVCAALDGRFGILVRYEIYRASCLSNSRLLNGSDNGDDRVYTSTYPQNG